MNKNNLFSELPKEKTYDYILTLQLIESDGYH